MIKTLVGNIILITLPLRLVELLVLIIARLTHFIPLSTLLTMYRSLVAPYSTYGIITWGQAVKPNLRKILILQKRALRLMHFFPNEDHILPLFISSNILPINLLYFETAHDSVPLNLKNLFRSSNQVHTYNTRINGFPAQK